MQQNISPNFSTLILSIAHSAKVGLGKAEHPESKKMESNLKIAQYNIDLLILLQEKTKNNLDMTEEKLLASIIGDLQMDFITLNSNKINKT